MKETTITDSWQINSAEWIKAIEDKTIESRKITSPAVYEILLDLRPQNVLDIGCGQGWLSHALSEAGIETVGLDATPALIDQAKIKGGNFYVKTYEEIIESGTVPGSPYEAIVFNFCLYHEMETESLLKTVKEFLHKRKLVVIQTLHPFAFMGTDFNYENQWIEDSWKGLKGNFHSPHAWYYRTLAGWMSTLQRSGLQVVAIEEPKAPQAKTPSSIIFILTAPL